MTAQKLNQSISVSSHAPLNATYNTSFTVAATASGGGAVAFSSSGVCSNSGSTFTMNSGTGTCQVLYDQPGNANYNPASQVVELVTAQKASQSINVTSHAPASAVFNTSFGVAANAPGGVVSFSSGGACSNSGSTFTMNSGTGTCQVRYDQVGNANFSPASQIVESVTAQKAAQTITVTTHAPSNAPGGQSFTVAATAPGGPVTFSSAGPCSNINGVFSVANSAGTCSVRYDQLGTADYTAAPQIVESVTVTVLTAPAAPTGVSATAANKQATVVWNAPTSNGGSPITGYVVTPFVSGVGQTPVQVGLVTQLTVTGLTNGTTYTFKVAAKNAVGTASSLRVERRDAATERSGDHRDYPRAGKRDRGLELHDRRERPRWQHRLHERRRVRFGNIGATYFKMPQRHRHVQRAHLRPGAATVDFNPLRRLVTELCNLAVKALADDHGARRTRRLLRRAGASFTCRRVRRPAARSPYSSFGCPARTPARPSPVTSHHRHVLGPCYDQAGNEELQRGAAGRRARWAVDDGDPGRDRRPASSAVRPARQGSGQAT